MINWSEKFNNGSKNGKHVFSPGFTPDIAIDDIHDCDLGFTNLIVHEK